MARLILLDAGPIGLLSTRHGIQAADRCRVWIDALVKSRGIVVIPGGADYEVRRELLRMDARANLALLDDLRGRFGLLVPTDDVWIRAAEFWAIVRRAGKPTADPHALDADCLLAAQASLIARPGDVVTIATTNVAHLNRFPGIDAREWTAIAP